MMVRDTHKKFISIITVVYNDVSVIEKAILSVIKQNFDDYEYLIIDGKSNDGTFQVLKKYEQYFSVLISEGDDGIYDAMNKGIDLAEGDWIYFLGADDTLYNNALDKIAPYLYGQNKLVYGDVYRPHAKRWYDGKFSALKLSTRNICHQSIFYHKNIFKKYKFNNYYRVYADYALNIICFSDPDIKFSYIPVPVAIFNDIGGVSNRNNDLNFNKDKLLLVKKNFPKYIYILSIGRAVLLYIFDLFKINQILLFLFHIYLREKNKRKFKLKKNKD